jgi:hypothetical protein
MDEFAAHAWLARRSMRSLDEPASRSRTYQLFGTKKELFIAASAAFEHALAFETPSGASRRGRSGL